MRPPFPFFGTKRKVAAEVWRRFGRVRHYIEPFFGTGAVLFANQRWRETVEVVNDLDAMIANFWRAVQADPVTVARYADQPVNESELVARHLWLVGRRGELQERVEGDPHYYDSKVAGWWVWGISAWIGSGWCSGVGPWKAVDGKVVYAPDFDVPGVHRRRPSNTWRGVHRLEFRDYDDSLAPVLAYIANLSVRLRYVTVLCGDWTRAVSTESGMKRYGTPVGIFLDPPYGDDNIDADMYTVYDASLSASVRQFCLEHGNDPDLRIAVCGYGDEHSALEEHGWVPYRWSAGAGYGNTSDDECSTNKVNRHRETVWFSPHCIRQLSLF